MKRCSKCGAENPDDKHWCQNCRKPLTNLVLTDVTQAEVDEKSTNNGSRLRGSMGNVAYTPTNSNEDSGSSPESSNSYQNENTGSKRNTQKSEEQTEHISSRLTGKMGSKQYERKPEPVPENPSVCPDKHQWTGLSQKSVKAFFTRLRIKKISIIAAAILLLISFSLLTGVKKRSTSSLTKPSSVPVVLTSFPEKTVTNSADALRLIEENANQLGIHNVTQEISSCEESTVLGTTFYRFSQTYQGVPVYGREVIVSADENNTAQTINHNYLSIQSLNTMPTLSAEEAIYAAKLEYGGNVQIYSNGLTIYSLFDSTPTLAWHLSVTGSALDDTCFVNAHTGEIITSVSNIYTRSVEGTCSNKYVFNTTEIGDGTYALIDQVRNIEVYDAQKQNMQLAFVDDNNNHYSYRSIDGSDRTELVDSNGDTIYILGNYEDIGKLTVVDNEGNIIGQNADLLPCVGEPLERLSILTNSNTIWTNKKAAMALAYAADTHDFFNNVLNRSGFNDDHGRVRIVVNDEIISNGIKDTTNSYQRYGQSNVLTFLSFGYNSDISADLVAHEFTHAVERTISNLTYENESGAIMEALSDIFGELVEDYSNDHTLDDDCDWVHGNRRLNDPFGNIVNDYPKEYHGAFYYSGDNDSQFVHQNSTVLSHAAYLMTHPDSKDTTALTNTELAQLLYYTMGFLPTDCTFSHFAHYAQLAASELSFSAEKITCITTAFRDVGVYEALDSCYTIRPDCTLNVFGYDGELYDNYSLRISGIDNTRINESLLFEKIEVVSNPEPYQLNLPIGSYTFTLTDNSCSDRVHVFTVSVSDTGMSTLPYATEFGYTAVACTLYQQEMTGDQWVPANIPNVAISIYSYNDSTFSELDVSDSQFEVPLSSGKYSIVASADGYNDTTTSFEIDDGEVFKLSIYLEQTSDSTNTEQVLVKFMLSEYVESTNPEMSIHVSTATLNIRNEADNSICKTINLTNEAGIFDALLEPGVYIVNGEVDGYSVHESIVEVTSDMPAYVTIPVSPDEVFAETTFADGFDGFMGQKAYQPYWDNTFSLYGSPTQYAFVDINNDNVQELIICSDSNFGFYSFLIFEYQEQKNQVTLLPVAANGHDIISCYGGLAYSKEYSAIVFTETNDGYAFGGLEYYSKDGEKLTSCFYIGYENYGDSNAKYYTSDEDNISYEKYCEYLAETVDIEFAPINEYSPISSSRNNIADETPEVYAAYVPVVEQAISDTTNVWHSLDYPEEYGWAYGILFDLDFDGTDELLLNYSCCMASDYMGDDWPYTVFSVYDYENGNLKIIVDYEKIVLHTGAAYGYAGVVNYKGTPTILVCSEDSNGTGPGTTHWYDDALYSYPSMNPIRLLEHTYYWAEWGDDSYVYYIEGEEVTRSEFKKELADCEYLELSESGGTIYTYDAMTLTELLEYLQSNA